MSIPIKNKVLADQFIAALIANNGPEATRLMMTLGAADTLAALFNLVKASPDQALLLILRARTYNFLKNRLGFFCTVAARGYLPEGTFTGIEPGDYHTARMFVIGARDAEDAGAKGSKTFKSAWGDRKQLAAKHRFYPEYGESSLRKRIVHIASDHVGKGPGDEMQALLFSLGGAFSFAEGKSVTRPNGTTCVLVARAIWHAAGINVVNQGTLSYVPKGPFVAMPKGDYGYVESPGDELKSIMEGDIFVIRGGKFSNGNDSTHVGIITSVVRDGDSIVWNTIEGGAKNHVTKRNTRKLVKTGGGRYFFENDTEVEEAVRPRTVEGYYSVTNVSGGKRMNQKAAHESAPAGGSESMPSGGGSGTETYHNK